MVNGRRAIKAHRRAGYVQLNIIDPYAQRRVMRSAGVSVLVGAGSAVERCA